MAIALRAAQGTGTAAAGTTITMVVPTGVVNGDVMVMMVSSKSTTIPSLPAGWTSLVTNAATPASRISWKIAGNEPANYAVTTASVQSAGTIIALSGASGATPIVAQYGIQNNSTASTTISAPALGTFTSSNGIDLFFAGQGALSSTPVPPTNYTEPTNGKALSAGLSSAAIAAEVAYRSLSGVTTVGALTSGAWSASGTSAGGHVFITEGSTTPAQLLQTKTITNASASPGTVAMSNTTAGNALIVGIVYSNTTASPVSGITNGGDTFSKILSVANSLLRVELWYAPNIAARTTPTVSVAFNATSGNISAIVREYSGLSTSPLDVSTTGFDSGGSTAMSSGATATTTSANELIIGLFGDSGGSQTYTAGTGYGALTSVVNSSSQNIAIEDKQVNITGSQTATATLGISALWAGGVATFALAGSGGGTVTVHNLTLLGVGA